MVASFDTGEAEAINKAQMNFFNPNVPQDLAFIHAHFAKIASAIEKLEAQNIQLSHALEIVANVRNELDDVPGIVGENIRKKMANVFDKNPGFDAISVFLIFTSKTIKIFKRIAIILNGGHIETELPPNVIANFKYAPIQSCDVERSFSIYKKVLADDRTNFTPENLEMYLICHCNE